MDQTVTPYLLYEDGDAAIEFATRAFGFREVNRMTGSAGGLHAELEVGSSGAIVYLGQPPSGFRNPAAVGRTSLVHVILGDVDAHYERAKGAGAEITEELVDLPFGHRRYTCADPQGHEWSFAQPMESAVDR
jgi:PhnB protein